MSHNTRSKANIMEDQDQNQGYHQSASTDKTTTLPDSNITTTGMTPIARGTKVRKFFDNYGWYNGQVISYRFIEGIAMEASELIYKVRYTDGDCEEYSEKELREIQVVSNGPGGDDDDDDDDDNDDDDDDYDDYDVDIKPPTATRGKSNRVSKKKRLDLEEEDYKYVYESDMSASDSSLSLGPEEDDDFAPGTNNTPRKKKVSGKVSVVTPSPKKRMGKKKKNNGATPSLSSLNGRSLVEFGLPRGALARHRVLGFTVRSMVGIPPLKGSASKHTSMGGTRNKAVAVLFSHTSDSPIPGSLMLVQADQDGRCPPGFVGRVFKSGAELEEAFANETSVSKGHPVKVTYETMEAVADPKFSTFEFAKARLESAGLLPSEDDSNQSSKQGPYVVCIEWKNANRSEISGRVEWFLDFMRQCSEHGSEDESYGVDVNVYQWAILESQQKGLPPVLLGVNAALLSLNQPNKESKDIDDLLLEEVELSVNANDSGSEIVPPPSKNMIHVRLPASVVQKSIRRCRTVPLVEAASKLLLGEPVPGSTLAFLNEVWKGMLVDASPMYGSHDCLGLSSLVLLSLIAAVDPMWQLPPLLSRAALVAALRTATTPSSPWMGHAKNVDEWFLLERAVDALPAEARRAMELRNILRVAQVSIGGRLAFGKWGKFEGDPSAAAILAYINHERWSGSILRAPPKASDHESVVLLEWGKQKNSMPQRDSPPCVLDDECRLSAIEPGLVPHSLVLLQAVLPTPPTAWKKHSLPSLSRHVRTLIVDANPRVKEQVQLARLAAWGKRKASDGTTSEGTMQEYTSFREVVSITGSLSKQEHALIDCYEAVQKLYAVPMSNLRANVASAIVSESSYEEKDDIDVVPRRHVVQNQKLEPYHGRSAFMLAFAAAIEVRACGEVVSAMFAGTKEDPLRIQRIGKARDEGRELATAGGSTSGATAVPSLGYVQRDRSEKEKELFDAAEKEVARYWKGGRTLPLAPCPAGYQWELPGIDEWSGWGSDELLVDRTADRLEDGSWRFTIGGKAVCPFDARAVLSSCAVTRKYNCDSLVSLKGNPELDRSLKTVLYVRDDGRSPTATFALASGESICILNAFAELHSIAKSDRSNEGLIYDWIQIAERSPIPARTWRDALLAIRTRDKDHVVLGSGIQSDGTGAPRDMTEGVLLRIFYCMEALYPTALRKESAFKFRVRCIGAAYHDMLACLEKLGRGYQEKSISDVSEKFQSVGDEASVSIAQKRAYTIVQAEEGLSRRRKRARRRAAVVAREKVGAALRDVVDKVVSKRKRPDNSEDAYEQQHTGIDFDDENKDLDHAFTPLPSITTQLWPHQKDSVSKILMGVKEGKRGHADASAVGAGKTLTALATIVEVQKMMAWSGQVRHGVLVMLPTPALIKEWLLETALHTANFHVIEQREDGSLFSLTYKKGHPPVDGCALVISTLDRVASHPFIRQTSWDFVVVDECLSVQNASAKRTPSAWRQIEISTYGCLLTSATFFRSRFDQLFYMIRMLRGPLPRTMEWLPATIHEHIVCSVPESDRKWVLKPEAVSLPARQLESYRRIIDAFGRKQLNSPNDVDGRALWSDLEAFLRTTYEGRSKKNIYEKASVMSCAIVELTRELLRKKRRPLIFANTQNEADFLLRALEEAGVDATSWQSVSSERLASASKGQPFSERVVVAVKTTQGQGLNMQHHADSIICRPTAGDLLEQMKGRIDRPGQKLKELLLFCVFAEHTIEEAQFANIHLVGNFFRQYIAPVASKYRERIDVEAILGVGGTKELKVGTVRKHWRSLLEQAGGSGTFAAVENGNALSDSTARSFSLDDDRTSPPKAKRKSLEGADATKYKPLNTVKRNQSDPIAVKQQKERARNGHVSTVVRNWLFGEPEKTKTAKKDTGLPLNSLERFSDTTPPKVLTPATIKEALSHLTKHDPKLAAIIQRVGLKSLELAVGKVEKPTQSRFFDSCVRAITFTQVSIDAGNAFLRRLAIKVGACIEQFPSSKKKRVLDKAITAFKESDHEIGNAEELMVRLLEGRHNELLFTHDLVAELIKTCEVLNGKQSGYPHLCGVTFPCGKYDDHSLFLAMARAQARDPNARPVSSGYSRSKAGFIVSLVNDFTTGKLSGKKIEAASDRQAAKILLDVKGFGDWCVGEVFTTFLGRADIMLYGDLTIRNYINDIYDAGHHESTETLLESAADFPDTRANRNKIDAIAKKNNWYPYRSVVGLLMYYLQEQDLVLL